MCIVSYKQIYRDYHFLFLDKAPVIVNRLYREHELELDLFDFVIDFGKELFLQHNKIEQHQSYNKIRLSKKKDKFWVKHKIFWSITDLLCYNYFEKFPGTTKSNQSASSDSQMDQSFFLIFPETLKGLITAFLSLRKMNFEIGYYFPNNSMYKSIKSHKIYFLFFFVFLSINLRLD